VLTYRKTKLFQCCADDIKGTVCVADQKSLRLERQNRILVHLHIKATTHLFKSTRQLLLTYAQFPTSFANILSGIIFGSSHIFSSFIQLIKKGWREIWIQDCLFLFCIIIMNYIFILYIF